MKAYDDLTVEEFAAASGFTYEQLARARTGGELFACRIRDESFRRYPAYQLFPEIIGRSHYAR